MIDNELLVEDAAHTNYLGEAYFRVGPSIGPFTVLVVKPDGMIKFVSFGGISASSDRELEAKMKNIIIKAGLGRWLS